MIQKLAHAVGFEYQYVAADDQYAHSAVIFLLTPEGVISRYLYGIEFKPSNLKIGLLEASSGKIGTVMDRFLLYCFQYDPSSRGYSLTIFKIMQAAGLVTVLFLLGAVGFLVARRRKEEHNI
jgi:protein SCO1/2